MSQALSNVFKLHDVINVKDPAFGAKGDGVTDDSPAINNAIIAKNAAGGGVVWLPGNHTYRCVGRINVLSNVWLRGDGWSSIIATEFNGAAVRGNSVTDIQISDLKVVGQGVSGGTSQVGIEIIGVTRGIVTRCYITSTPLHGIMCSNATKQFIVSHNLVENTDANSTGAGSGIMASFEGSLDGVISNNIVQDVNAEGILVDAGTSGGTGTSSERISVVDNIVRNTGNEGIAISGCISSQISNNILSRIGMKLTNARNGIVVVQDNAVAEALPQRCVVSGNIIDVVSQHGIQVRGGVDCIVENNLVFNTGGQVGGPPAGNVFGVLISKGAGAGTPATTRGAVRNNIIRYSGTGGKLTIGVQIDTANAGVDVWVYGNTVSGQSGAVVLDVGLNNNYIGPNLNITASEILPNAFRGLLDTTNRSRSTPGTSVLSTKTIPANLMGNVGVIRVEWAGTLAGTNGTKTADLVITDGTTTKTFAGIATAIAAETDDWYGEALIMISGTNSQRVSLRAFLGVAMEAISGYDTSTVDFRSAVTIRVDGTLGSAGDTITQTMFNIDVLK